MKNLSMFFLLATCIVLGSCKDKKSETIVNAEEPVNEQCYKAIYEQDTLHLKINTLEDGNIKGSLVMIVSDNATKTGKLEGKFRGDTLFTNYTFTQGENRISTYKNPLAFLKRGNELILGNWVTDKAMGANYDDAGQPIDFDNVKYKFKTVDCVEK